MPKTPTHHSSTPWPPDLWMRGGWAVDDLFQNKTVHIPVEMVYLIEFKKEENWK